MAKAAELKPLIDETGAIEVPPAPEQLSLPAKLVAIMAGVHKLPKRGRNDFHKYDYLMESDVKEAMRDLFITYRVALVPTILEVIQREVGKQTVTRAQLSFLLINAENPVETLTLPWYGEGADMGDKGLAKSVTAAIKTWLAATFLIPTGNDTEGDEKTDRASAQRTEPPAPEPLGVKALEDLLIEAEVTFEEACTEFGVKTLHDLTSVQRFQMAQRLEKAIAGKA